ncbi:hypothetical protein V1227_04275 [Lentzea sp. DG1S-22]|nr:hypothetical protein [Lentzea sp. DG1S-22]WVH81975.1 hypothetical protein V1227_04275 [Lentzea sp. DG1S-22]
MPTLGRPRSGVRQAVRQLLGQVRASAKVPLDLPIRPSARA